MGIVGRAIGRYLRERQGVFAVELPSALEDEMSSLVSICNRNRENSAFLVLPEHEDGGSTDYGCATISWSELLRWRTNDDRVFVWARDTGEPHSSFQSVVTTFIGRRFPGKPGGTCSPRLLSRLCIEEIWRELGEEPEQESHSFRAFRETLEWVNRVICHNYQYNGGSPKAHWSDGFFVHWSRMCEGLAAEFSRVGETGYRPEAGDAWEIFRQAGLPIPVEVPEDSRILTHPPINAIADSKQTVARLSNQWQELADSYVLPEGKIAILRSALDKFCAGESGDSPWSGLPLEKGSDAMVGTPAVEAIRPVFTDESAQSYLSREKKLREGDQTRRWWRVTLPAVLEALERLTEEKFLSPVKGGGPLYQLDSEDDTYLILTHRGRVEYDHTDKYWRVYVRFEDLAVEYAEHWASVLLRQSEPDDDPGEGIVWVKPGDVDVQVRGTGVKITDVTPTPAEDGTKLNIGFRLEIKYQATRDDGSAQGSWKPSCTFKVKTRVREWTDGSWQVRTTEESELNFVVPSPFSPTVIVDAGQVIVPENDDSYEYENEGAKTGEWRAISTPDLLLDEEREVELLVYNGHLSADGSEGNWLPATNVVVDSTELDPVAERIWTTPEEDALFLREGNSISIRRAEDSPEEAVATVRIKESRGHHTSALEALVQGHEIGEPDPAAEARESLLGEAQQAFARSLVGDENSSGLDSLYQYILSTTASGVEWRECSGTSEPVYLAQGIDSIAGAGKGVSDELRAASEWSFFTRAAREVAGHLRLKDSDGAVAWLSSVPFKVVPAQVVQRYVTAHAELLDRARTLAAPDLFWASFPFSVFVVEGESSAELGALRSVLLSPLHPVRFAWQFGYELLASRCNRETLGKVILGLAESWNIPLTGTGISRTGQSNPLVSAPLSAGDGNDFVGWSGLALLRTDSGLPYYPPRAGGYDIPWAGQSGINNRVVREALDDFVEVHPHLTALEIDVRSQREGPRSREIDQALLAFVREAVFGDMALGGGVRVWDGIRRIGSPPRREAVVPESGGSGLFEWRRYDERTNGHADISFIENPNVNFSIDSVTEGESSILGAVPLRRFLGGRLDGDHLVQAYRTSGTCDLIGLSALLDGLEYGNNSRQPALLATVSAEGLGLEQDSRWDVLGSLNIDPALLASIATESQGKILWEWRPSWLKSFKRGGTLTPRPYYVVAAIPASLVQALERQHGISEARVSAMLSTLGEAGIGLATLSAQGGTQASAAAGFYYAMKMLAASIGTEERPGEFRGLLPLDPVFDLVSSAAGRPASGRRADFVLVEVTVPTDESPIVQMMPVEVKHRGRLDRPAPFPDRDSSGLRDARDQLLKTAGLLEEVVENAAGADGGEDPWTEYGHRLALASLLELSCSLGSRRASPAVRNALVSGVLDGSVSIGVTDPLLLWYAPGAADNEGVASRYETNPQEQYVVHELFVDPDSVPGMLWEDGSPGDNERHTLRRLREAIDAALSGAVPAAAFDASGGPIVQRLRESVGLPAREEEAEAVSGDEGGGGETGGDRETGDGPSSKEKEAHPAGAQDPIRESSGGDTTVPQEGEETRHVEREGDPAGVPDPVERERAEVEEEERVDQDAEKDTGDTGPTPDILIGAEEITSRWTIVGKTPRTEESVALDLNNPKTVGVFGYMGSGKSYFLGTLIESAVEEITGINRLRNPLSVVVFNYRQQASDRFELGSLIAENQDAQQVDRLRSEYGAAPRGLEDIHVLHLPGAGDRHNEYQGLHVHEMCFDPIELSLEDWELLMGEPESNRVYAQTIRHCLNRLHQSGEKVTLPNLMARVEDQLSGSSLSAARRRFEFARDYLSEDRGVDFNELLEPGRVVIVDLRKSLFKKEDALRFFLICARQVSKVQGEFNKLIIFDEAHEYLSDEFGARMESRIRLMRHEGTSYVFATQDVDSIPEEVRRFITTNFVFELGTRQNVKDLISRFGKIYEDENLLSRDTGSCLIQANKSTNDIMAKPRDVIIRPRVTSHGGESRIHDVASE